MKVLPQKALETASPSFSNPPKDTIPKIDLTRDAIAAALLFDPIKDIFGASDGNGPFSFTPSLSPLGGTVAFNPFYNTPGDASASFYAGIGFPWGKPTSIESFFSNLTNFNPTFFGANASLPLGNGFYLNANIEHTQPYVGQGKTTWGISASRGR